MSIMLEVGGLPTDLAPYSFDSLRVRPFTVGDLAYIHLANTTNNLGLLIDVVNARCDQDVSQLSKGDFGYLLAFMRTQSFPETPRVVTWRCRNSIGVDVDGVMSDKPHHHEPCNRLNTENVHHPKMEIVPYSAPDCAHVQTPSIALYDELNDSSVSGPARDLIWFKEGKTLAEKIKAFYSLPSGQHFEVLKEIRREASKDKHGIVDLFRVKCGRCGFTTTLRQPADPLHILPKVSRETLNAIKYNLLTQFNTHIRDDDPAMELLYFNSSLEKDKLEHKEKQDALRASQGGPMRTVKFAR